MTHKGLLAKEAISYAASHEVHVAVLEGAGIVGTRQITPNGSARLRPRAWTLLFQLPRHPSCNRCDVAATSPLAEENLRISPERHVLLLLRLTEALANPPKSGMVRRGADRRPTLKCCLQASLVVC